MACFLAPAVAAIITAGVGKKVPSKYHTEWLSTMLWGGVVMLAVEHIAHGEVVFYPPFLTAMQNPADILVMLQEIATVGGAMTLAIVMVWTVMIFAVSKMTRINENKIQTVRA